VPHAESAVKSQSINQFILTSTCHC